ncbi:MAG: hypothetical protein OXF06_11855 [Bacteroidetes bacterium]|nr:hypothetical protein [Bacteroidota bacterium]
MWIAGYNTVLPSGGLDLYPVGYKIGIPTEKAEEPIIYGSLTLRGKMYHQAA